MNEFLEALYGVMSDKEMEQKLLDMGVLPETIAGSERVLLECNPELKERAHRENLEMMLESLSSFSAKFDRVNSKAPTETQRTT